MIVVDTNVIAYFFIDGDKTAAARALWDKDSQWRVPELWRHEYVNVLATYARAGGISDTVARQLWFTAEAMLAPMEHEMPMDVALSLAVDKEISAYDAQFVVLADVLNTRLVTEDRRLLEQFPDIAVSL